MRQKPVRSYDYQHRDGVTRIGWEDFAALSARLAEELSRENIQVVVGIARAGLFPATAVACALRCELFPIRLTRREDDRVVHERPVWKVRVSPEVRGKVVAVVDEIADTGETLAEAARAVEAAGASRVVTASLLSHGWARPRPAVSAMVTDALVIFPWDAQVYVDGRWCLHPELQAALEPRSS